VLEDVELMVNVMILMEHVYVIVQNIMDHNVNYKIVIKIV